MCKLLKSEGVTVSGNGYDNFTFRNVPFDNIIGATVAKCPNPNWVFCNLTGVHKSSDTSGWISLSYKNTYSGDITGDFHVLLFWTE